MAPLVQRLVVNADNGTAWPLSLSTFSSTRFVRLHCAQRLGLHDHSLQPPLVGEVIDVGRASAVEITPLIAAKLTPSALALSRSFHLYLGCVFQGRRRAHGSVPSSGRRLSS